MSSEIGFVIWLVVLIAAVLIVLAVALRTIDEQRREILRLHAEIVARERQRSPLAEGGIVQLGAYPLVGGGPCVFPAAPGGDRAIKLRADDEQSGGSGA